MTSSTEIAVRPSRLPAAIRAMRPRQWVKNILVATAPLAAGQLFDADGAAPSVALAFVAFCLVSAAVYLVNDIRDVEEDRLHPRKRFRPIAAGELRAGRGHRCWPSSPARSASRWRSWSTLPLGITLAGLRRSCRSSTPPSSSTCRSSTWPWWPAGSCCARSPAAWRPASR